MTAITVLKYIEEDDEFMYFEVFNLEKGEYVSKGTVYIGKVLSLATSPRSEVKKNE